MEADLLLKGGTLLFGAVGTWKLLVEFSRGRHGHLRDEYKFARDFLDDLKQKPDMHPFVKQKGFQAIAGDTQLTAAEIEYLLTLTDPAQSLRNFVLGKQYLDYFATSTGRQVVFKPKFQAAWPRLWRKLFYITAYFVCYMAGFAPLLVPAFEKALAHQMFSAFAVTACIFFPSGFLALRAGVRIAKAESLVKTQFKHSEPILLDSVRSKR